MPEDGPTTHTAIAESRERFEIEQAPLSEATWHNMPYKKDVIILMLSRFADFFQQAAIQTYGYYQLRSFDAEISESDVTRQTGMLFASFTLAQIVSSFLWGVAADKPEIGRKLVLLIGLVGTAFGCIGVAFSTSFQQAVFWRFFCGAVNGTVGSARSMLGERVPKAWHSRAFLLFPAAFNMANVAGPLLSGILTEHSNNQAEDRAMSLLQRYPYAAPNLLCTVILLLEAALVQLHLRETLANSRPFTLQALLPERTIQGLLPRRRYKTTSYSATRDDEGHLLAGDGIEMQTRAELTPSQRLPMSSICTANVFWVLVSIAIFDFHLGAFNNLWVLMLTAARNYVPTAETGILRRGLFKFSGGLSFTPTGVGVALSIIGYIGVALQLLLYPPASQRYGLLKCFRVSIFLFPLAYYLAPFVAQLPSSTPSPEPASGVVIWFGIAAVVLLQVAARTFAMPAVIILLNNASPHPSVLGTINGLAQACSATFRTLGPWASSYWFNTWRERGVIGMAWWFVASIAALGCVASFWVEDGNNASLAKPKVSTQSNHPARTSSLRR